MDVEAILSGRNIYFFDKMLINHEFKGISGNGMFSLIIGDSDMITGFKLVGVEGTEVASSDEAQQALNDALTRKDLAIIIISEEFSSQPSLRQQIDRVRQETVTPLILEIPGSRGQTSGTPLSEVISKILGIKI
jgi:V/A-type H+-transporting ATPase subunit F